MANQIEFRYTGVVDNKFEKDGNGYWVCCGALNSFNRANEWYIYSDSIKEMFFNRKFRFGQLLQDGLLGGEAEHPIIPANLDDYSKSSLFLNIAPERRSHNILGVRFVETDQYPSNSKGQVGPGKMVKIYCHIIPLDNHLGRTLRSMLEGNGNVAFSVRAYTRDVFNPATGFVESAILNPITFDWVSRGGIGCASKDKTIREFKNENDLSMNIMKMDMDMTCANIKIPLENDRKCENHDAVVEMVNIHKESLVNGNGDRLRQLDCFLKH